MKKEKHLEFLQNIINRLNANSFIIKGWSISLIAAIFILSQKESKMSFLAFATIPILAFWIMDSIFLSNERKFRYIYNQVRILDEDNITFEMNIGSINIEETKRWNCFKSDTLLYFHGTLFILLVVFSFVLPYLQ